MAKRARGRMVSPGEGEGIWFGGHLYDWKVTAEDTRGSFSAVVLTLAPAPAVGAPPHVHRTEHEAFYILDGELSVRLGGPVSLWPGSRHRDG